MTMSTAAYLSRPWSARRYARSSTSPNEIAPGTLRNEYFGAGLSGAEARTMAKEYINPESLFRSVDHGFSQGVAASGRRTLYVSGQTAWDSGKQLVGGMDLAVQARLALRQLRNGGDASGGTLAHGRRPRL